MRLPLITLAATLPLTHAIDPLNQILSSLLSTLFSHDPTTLTARLSPFLLSTENNIPTPLGTSPLWQFAVETPPTEILPWGPQHRHVDFSTGQAVAVTTVLLEGGKPAILVMRVRVTGRDEVGEVETVVVGDDVEGARGYRAVKGDEGVEMGPEWEGDGTGVGRLEEGRVGEVVGGWFGVRDVGGEVGGMVGEGCYRVDNGRVSGDCKVEGGEVGVPWKGAKTQVRGRRLVVHAVDVQRQGAVSFATVDVEAEGRSWLVVESVRLDGKEKVDRVELIWTEVAYGSDAGFQQATGWSKK